MGATKMVDKTVVKYLVAANKKEASMDIVQSL